MTIRTITALALLLTSNQIWAVGTPNGDCDRNGRQVKVFRKLIREARITDHVLNDAGQKVMLDGRKGLLEIMKGEPQEKIDMALRNTVRTFCPFFGNRPDGSPLSTSGAIVGTNVTLGTSDHNLFAPNGKLRFDPKKFDYSKCVVVNYDLPKPGVTHLNIRVAKFGTNRGRNLDDDWGIVRLTAPIPGANGYPVDPTGAILARGTEYLNISQTQEGTSIPRDTPTGQIVKNYRYNPPQNDNPAATVIVSGDSSPGISGSILLANEPKMLVAAAFVKGGHGVDPSRNWLDGDPFDVDTNSIKAVAIDQRIIQAINEVAGPEKLVQIASLVSN